MRHLSPLQQQRLKYQPSLPPLLQQLSTLQAFQQAMPAVSMEIRQQLPHTCQQPLITFQKGANRASDPLRVGVLLSGGQAPGGHNVITGLYDALKSLNADSELIGFLDGFSGLIKNRFEELSAEGLAAYRNQGGFDVIGSGRTKIESPDQLYAVEATARVHRLDALVIIGGDDSNTNAALLAEDFDDKGIRTKVIGVPKTIDGDLQNDFLEISFGFDTACKIYSEIIGNILIDTLSAKKTYYFIKLMGRSASHITLECALRTHPNMALISEEIHEQGKTLSQLVHEIADMICLRASQGKNYGAILIPEGVIEFIPEVKQMIVELNRFLHDEDSMDKRTAALQMLSPDAIRCFKSLPEDIQKQLLLDRDPHGNVQVSKIETERLFMTLVGLELAWRKSEGKYVGKYSPQPYFCGYEGRSGLPSNFDCQYGYALGFTAALLADIGATGYMSCIQRLAEPVAKWRIAGVPLTSMMHIEERSGQWKPVIRKALVDLKGKAFTAFKESRDTWMTQDDYLCPGPIQFEGPPELVEEVPLTLRRGD